MRETDFEKGRVFSMKKGIILWKSKYGATEKYANWVAETTGYDCVKLSEAALQKAVQYEIIVICGGIYASGIAGLPLLKKHIAAWKGKKIAVFCVGASPYNEKAFQELKIHNMKDALCDIPLFYGRGAWDESIMTFKDRTLCKMLQKALSKKDPADYEPWMEACMSAVGQVRDWTDRKYLMPLLNYLEE